jgi:phosphoenolpyruvate synthase/pyruvate phosphate dikinase
MSVRHLHSIRGSHLPSVGGKAASLGDMLAAGHPVPPAFVITADEAILSPTLSSDILKAYDVLGSRHVAVRSSGIGEDGAEQSWAGQFATILHVDRNGLLDAVRECWNSANSLRVAHYAHGISIDLAVLVQHMVHSDVAGVAFSANPITGNRDEIVVEAVYGLGELLVQGIVTPDNFVLSKHTGDIILQDIATKEVKLAYAGNQIAEVPIAVEAQNIPALEPHQLQKIAQLTREIEAYYGYPVDIEWAFEQGALYLLQARPITTL